MWLELFNVMLCNVTRLIILIIMVITMIIFATMGIVTVLRLKF